MRLFTAGVGLLYRGVGFGYLGDVAPKNVSTRASYVGNAVDSYFTRDSARIITYSIYDVPCIIFIGRM